MDTDILKYVGKKLYQTQYLKELKRYWVFRTRCRLHSAQIEALVDFFNSTALRKELLLGTPAFIEQATRAFFYKDSDYEDRIRLIENHIEFMESKFTPEALLELYGQGKRVVVWQDAFDEHPLEMVLWFHAGQRKEGCLSLTLTLDGTELYQIMFWFAPDADGKPAIWIGALQGTPNGSDTIKAMTKAFFGYRTKNLIFYGIRNVARCLGIEKIYAVTNQGYYAMNHVRADRKLKTSFADFWEECEGTPCEDKRFYVMPVEEYRKDMSELKPSKRAQHRRRFEKLDSISAAFDSSFNSLLK